MLKDDRSEPSTQRVRKADCAELVASERVAMFLHLGNGFTVATVNVVAVMDIEKASTSRITREYLAEAGKAGRVVTCSYELPKSFVVSLDDELTERVYICGVAAETLRKRLDMKL